MIDAITACLMLVATYDPPGLPEATSVECVTQAEADEILPGAQGIYHSGRDTIYIVAGLSDEWTLSIYAHEAGHAIDVAVGSVLSGRPHTWWSVTYNYMDAEVFAAMYTEYVGKTHSAVAPPSMLQVPIWVAMGVFPDLGQPKPAGYAPLHRLYCAFFDRAPDAAGVKYWYDSGLSLGRVADEFALSDEYRLRYGGTDNAEYVASMYAYVLRRMADVEGYKYWLTELDEGRITRGHLMVEFSESEEYVKTNRCEA